MASIDEPKLRMLDLAIRNRSAIMGVIVGMIRDFDVAEDIFQEVVLVIAESNKAFDSEKEFLRWSWGVARNKVLQHWQKLKRRPIPTDPVILEAGASAVCEEDDPDVWRKEKAFLQQCLQELTPRNQALFMHRYADNLKGPALASRTGMKIGSLRTTLLRIRAALRRCIEGRMAAAGAGGES